MKACSGNQLRPQRFTALILPVETVYPWQHAGNTITPFSAESDETHSHHAGPALDALSEVVDCLEHRDECVRVWWRRRCECPCCSLHSCSQSCMSRHVNILLKFLWNTSYLSLTHPHMRTCKKGDTPYTRTLNNSDTTNTESQLTHNEQQVWVAAWATDISNLFWSSRLRRKRFHSQVIFTT